jgi:hypothetical protein
MMFCLRLSDLLLSFNHQRGSRAAGRRVKSRTAAKVAVPAPSTPAA